MFKERHENATVIPSNNGSIEMTVSSPKHEITTPASAPASASPPLDRKNSFSFKNNRQLPKFRLFRLKKGKENKRHSFRTLQSPHNHRHDGLAHGQTIVRVTPKVRTRKDKDENNHKVLTLAKPLASREPSPLPTLQEEVGLSTSSSSDYLPFYRSAVSLLDGDTNENDEPEADYYSSYFLKTDFIKDTWMETVSSQSAESLSLGFLSIMAATVVIHPILFVTGAATAVWAVGVVHALDKGYEFFSDGQFKNMFWADREVAEQMLLMGNEVTKGCNIDAITTEVEETNSICTICVDADADSDVHAEGKVENSTPNLPLLLPPPRIEISPQSPVVANNGQDNTTENIIDNDRSSSVPSIPVSPLYSPASKPNATTTSKRHVKPFDKNILAHFPPLENDAVKAEFPGLNALEFFHVFLADDAPYSFKEFQQTRGDVDINFGKWKRRNESDDAIADVPISFHPGSKIAINDGEHKLPTSSKKERELTFKTLTKSYFGPAYASAKKTQRVTKFSTRLVIVESKTELFDIPYADRFFVVERWIIEAIKHDGEVSDPQKSMVYTSKLSVSVEVFMLKACPWEKQIRQKTLSTITDLVTSWTSNATKALDLTIKRKLERMRLLAQNDGDRSLVSYRSKDSRISLKDRTNKVSGRMSPPGKSEQALMSMHQRQLKILEEKIAAGDLEWCSIEIKHSIEAGTGKAFAKILNPSHAIRDTDVLNDTEQTDRMNDCPKIISIQPKAKSKKRSFRIIKKKK